MSYNLSFWRYKENSYLDNHKVYETLCDEGNIEGLEMFQSMKSVRK